MANIFKNNFSPTSGSHLMYELKTLLMAAGWILKGNGDGSTNFSNVADNTVTPAGTDYITSTTAASVNRNWWRVRMANTTAEFVFQHNNASVQHQWRIKFSPTGFVGGTPSATQVPSATDEVVLCGGGTDASPSYTQIFSTTDGSYRTNIMCQDAAPYGFWMACFPNGGGSPNGGMMLDPVAQANGADTFQYVVYLSQSNGNAYRMSSGALDFTTENGASSPRAYLSTTLSAANFVSVLPLSTGFFGASTNTMSGFLGTNVFDSKDTLLATPYVRRSALVAPVGHKGFSTFMRLYSGPRLTGDTVSESTTRDRIIIGEVALPWDGSTPLV